MADTTYPPDAVINGGGGGLVVGSSETVGSKRQRRPSVRLGDIGGGGGGGGGGDQRPNQKQNNNLDTPSSKRLPSNQQTTPIHHLHQPDADMMLYHQHPNTTCFTSRVSHLQDFSDTDAINCTNGVRIWLNALGLARYAPVFEIHEVDDEVLPMLTLDDLKDMGINAVGSRRKMYSAIQKLGKGFS